MSYDDLKRDYQTGWHTWNNRSVLSHVHMPDGLSLGLAFKEYASGAYLKETLIGRFGADDEKVFPGPHAFDGSYTSLRVSWRDMMIRVESTQSDEGLVLLVTPEKAQIRPAMLVVETGYLWNRPGHVAITGEGRAVAHSPSGDTPLFGLAGEFALLGCEESVRQLDFSATDARALDTLLKSRRRPDAIVCGNDEHAILLTETLTHLGKRIPEDVAVVGFDDIAAAPFRQLFDFRLQIRIVRREDGVRPKRFSNIPPIFIEIKTDHRKTSG